MAESKGYVERIGHTIELDPIRVAEVANSGRCTFISTKFYNKGLYRIKSTNKNSPEDFAIKLDRVEAATYNEVVNEVGRDAVDRSLWEEVGEDNVIFFYSFAVVEDVASNIGKGSRYIEA